MRQDPTGRALHLLSLLQTHKFWRGADLADRLEITERTVRRDVDRLRELGYPVNASTGKYGGYRLETGAHMPPLVLDDDEAVAVAIGLRYAAEAAIVGFEETSLRALTKIEQLLPHRLRRRISALHSSVMSTRSPSSDDVVDHELLSVLAAACRDRENARFEYQRGDGERSRRHVEPHQLVTSGRRWYLVAWDHERGEWRTFRLDRMREPRVVGSHFTSREIPGGNAADFVARAIGGAPRQSGATITVGASYDEIESVVRWIDHSPLEIGDAHCVLRVHSEDLGRLSLTVARIALTAPVAVIEPAELKDTIARLSTHLGNTGGERTVDGRGRNAQLRGPHDWSIGS